MKKLIIILLMAACIGLPLKSQAASSLQVVAEDALWGVLIGSLLGTASLAFTDEPSDHLDYIARGAAVGAFAGIAFGIYEIHPIFTAYKTPNSEDTVYGMKLYIPLK